MKPTGPPLAKRRAAAHILRMTGQNIVPYDPGSLDLRAIRRNEAKVERGLWSKLRRSLKLVPFLEEAAGAYYCAFDPRTPRPVKAMLLAALAYFVVPSDVIPDFVAGLGFTDDATVLFATLRMVAGHITDQHRDQARRRLVALGLRDPIAAPGAAKPGADEGV